MILYIDTSQFNSVKFSLKNEGKLKGRLISKKYKLTAGGNHQTVALLDKFLRGQKIKPNVITKIAVAVGPGSFNGIRVGISIAQALGLAWKIPIKAIPSNEIAKLLSPK